MQPRTIAIIFMIAPAHDLEWKSILLVASIRQFAPPDVAVYACIEANHLPLLAPETVALLDRMRVTLRPLSAKSPFKPVYKMGNKQRACSLDYTEDRLIFLDSDMMFAGPSDLSGLTQGDIVVQQEFGQVWEKDAGPGAWEHIYKSFDISAGQVAALHAIAGKFPHPYFNGGLVSFRNQSDFGKLWLEICLQIDADPAVPGKRPWLDQIALPIAIMKSGQQLVIAPDAINKRPTRDNLNRLRIAHYHGLIRLRLSDLDRVADLCLRNQAGLRSLDHLLYLTQTIEAAARARKSAPFAAYAKVLGERNTGASLLEDILIGNFEVKQLAPRPGDKKFLNVARQSFGSSREHPDAGLDLLHRHSMDTQFGWKHTRPDVARFRRFAKFPYTRFLCIYKHPALWLKSMYRPAYSPNPAQTKPGPDSLHGFLTAPFPLSERDEVDFSFSGTPLEVYQEKLRGYLELYHANPEQTLIIPNEDMLRAPEQIFHVLAQHFKARAGALEFPEKAVKPEAANTSSHLAEYPGDTAGSDLFEGYDAAARAAYDSQIDTALFEELASLSCLRRQEPETPAA